MISVRRFGSIVAALFLLLPRASFATAYQDLQTHAGAFGATLQEDLQEQSADQADVTLEGKSEFFPESGTGSAKRSSSSAPTSGFVSFTASGATTVLQDVPLSAWFAPYVRDVADRGIVSGYRDASGKPTGVFGPERNVSIEELAKMAIGAAQIDTGSCTDTPKNPLAAASWSHAYIACAEQRSFAVYADGTVDIARPATRAEVVMTVLQAFGVTLRDGVPANTRITDVTDATLFSAAIYTALSDGIVSGYSDAAGNLTGKFGPQKPVNRAEVSKIISLAVQLYGH